MAGFDRESSKRIAKVVRQVEQESRNRTRRGIPPTPTLYNKLGITTSGISARSSKTPGSGTVQPYTYSGSTLVSIGSPETVLNWTSSAISSTAVWIQYQVIDGYLFLVGQDCGGGTP